MERDALGESDMWDVAAKLSAASLCLKEGEWASNGSASMAVNRRRAGRGARGSEASGEGIGLGSIRLGPRSNCKVPGLRRAGTKGTVIEGEKLNVARCPLSAYTIVDDARRNISATSLPSNFYNSRTNQTRLTHAPRHRRTSSCAPRC